MELQQYNDLHLRIEKDIVTATYFSVDSMNKLSVNSIGSANAFDKARYDELVTPIVEESELSYLAHEIALGDYLFKCLFPGQLEKFFRDCLINSTTIDKKTGLRLRLNIPDPEFSNMPWEFAYDHTVEKFLCSITSVLLTRYVGNADDLHMLLKQPRYKINLQKGISIKALSVAANAYGDTNIKADIFDKKFLYHMVNLPELNRVRITPRIPAHPTYLHVSRAVHEQFDIVHFYLHGRSDDANNVNLILEGSPLEQNQSSSSEVEIPKDNVDYERFIELFEGARGDKLSLLVLCACNSARVPTGGLGLAARLIRDRLTRGKAPAVISMQYPLEASKAFFFTETLYNFISQGYPIDYSMQATRDQMRDLYKGQRDFSTPVLYMNSHDGYVFERISDSNPYGDYIRITYDQQAEINRTILSRIEVIIEFHKKLLSNRNSDLQAWKALWRSEGGSDLFHILDFFQSHMNYYEGRFSKDERDLMERLLVEIPDSLDTIGEDMSGLESLKGLYAAAIALLSNHLENSRKRQMKSSQPHESRQDEKNLVNILESFYLVMDRFADFRMALSELQASVNEILQSEANSNPPLSPSQIAQVKKMVMSNSRRPYSAFRSCILLWLEQIGGLKVDNLNTLGGNLSKRLMDLDGSLNDAIKEINSITDSIERLRVEIKPIWSEAVHGIMNDLVLGKSKFV